MFYSFYKTPTNVIKSRYPCSLHWQSFFFFSSSPSSLSAFLVLRSHLGPSRLPLSRFLGRDENTLSETGSSASQNIVSGWGYPFVRSACFYLCWLSGGPTHPSAAGEKGREAELASSTAQPGDEMGELLQHTGAGMLARPEQHLTLSGKSRKYLPNGRVKYLTRSPCLELPRSPLVKPLPIKALMAGVVRKYFGEKVYLCPHKRWERNHLWALQSTGTWLLGQTVLAYTLKIF